MPYNGGERSDFYGEECIITERPMRRRMKRMVIKMAGFDWNQFYTLVKVKMSDTCTVGRYTIPKSPTYPYLDIALSDVPGGNYDLQSNAGSTTPLITIEVYCDNYDDAKCYEVSMEAKELMLSYGFQCRMGPIKVDNTDPAVARWGAKYQRIFGTGDKLVKVNE